ncbi:MAG: ABC transporter permease [Microbacterium sp.]
MKRYILFRAIRSVVSIVLVTVIVYTLIYTLVPRSNIFKGDLQYSKVQANPDDRITYVDGVLERRGYINFYTQSELLNQIAKTDPDGADAYRNDGDTTAIEAWAADHESWQVDKLPQSGEWYASRDVPIAEMVWKFFSGLVVIDHPWKVHDSTNPDLKRYVKFENSPSAGFALVGSGTEHRYLVYFNGSFPFIHQNIITLNLGTSYPAYSDTPVLDVISSGQGRKESEDVTFDTGLEASSSADIYSAEYKSPSTFDRLEKARYDVPYVPVGTINEDPSMLVTSFWMGLFGVIVAYAIGIPAAMTMARFKNKWPDALGIGIVTVLSATAGLSYIYFFRQVLGKLTTLPTTFSQYGGSDIRSYILPILILGGMAVPSIIVWVRRFMIDQQTADYVKFARAKGMSEREISFKHIFRNAIIPITQGIPAAIILTITGAVMTETIFVAPGMGKMLPDAILSYNNAMVVGLVFVFTTLSVVALFLGDLLLTVVDPRISLNEKKSAA